MSRVSFLNEQMRPSAILTDGVLTAALHAVTVVTLSQTYHLPPFGSGIGRAMIDTHDDTFSLSGLLVGDRRMLQKLALETLAESAMRGSPMGFASAGFFDGLVLVTSLGIRMNMFIQSLTITASSAKIGALDVSLSMIQAPRLGILGKLTDAALAVGALSDGT